MIEHAERPSFTFLGVRVDNRSFEDVREAVASGIRSRGYLCLTDVGNVVSGARDGDLRDAINGSLVSVCDGTPLGWFGRLTGCRRVERVSGVRLMSRLLAERNGYRHFLLGDTEETHRQIVARARRENPGVVIGGHSPPFRDFSEEDDQAMLAAIRRFAPDIVWLSFGGGKQEKWAYRNAHRLDQGVLICVGAAFRYYTGELREPPLILQKSGLQWLCRVLESPDKAGHMRRRWERYRQFLYAFPGEIIRGRQAAREFRVRASTPAETGAAPQR